MDILQLLNWLHALSSCFMAGLIWFVQIVHYPLFAQVGADAFQRYEHSHQLRTSWVVVPPMLLELGSALALAYHRPPQVPLPALLIGLGLVLLIWASTAFLQVPCHAALEKGFDASIARRLVLTNWLRTLAWSLRAILALWIFQRLTPT